MEHPIFFHTGLVLSSVLVFFGSNAMLRPDAHLKSLGFPVHTQPQAQKLNYALMRIWGVRNLTVGSLLILIWTAGNEKLMAKALCAALVMPITDGFVSRSLTGGGELQHWAFPPVMGVVIAGLFGIFD
jgi:hypothetical protein